MAGSPNCNHRNYPPQASGRRSFRRVQPNTRMNGKVSRPYNSDTLRIFSSRQSSYLKCKKGYQRLTANQRAMIARLGP